ncbi:hypothetical protein J6590_048938 [Homalodisca vitripennis]|nr:hypothetical protein J6590_048938 [Homalodisca vitripennis]
MCAPAPACPAPADPNGTCSALNRYCAIPAPALATETTDGDISFDVDSRFKLCQAHACCTLYCGLCKDPPVAQPRRPSTSTKSANSVDILLEKRLGNYHGGPAYKRFGPQTVAVLNPSPMKT